jgi:hypothetical protein
MTRGRTKRAKVRLTPFREIGTFPDDYAFETDYPDLPDPQRQEAIALRMGEPVAHVRQIEAGEGGRNIEEIFQAMAWALNQRMPDIYVSWRWLLYGEDG